MIMIFHLYLNFWISQDSIFDRSQLDRISLIRISGSLLASGPCCPVPRYCWCGWRDAVSGVRSHTRQKCGLCSNFHAICNYLLAIMDGGRGEEVRRDAGSWAGNGADNLGIRPQSLVNNMSKTRGLGYFISGLIRVFVTIVAAPLLVMIAVLNLSVMVTMTKMSELYSIM